MEDEKKTLEVKEDMKEAAVEASPAPAEEAPAVAVPAPAPAPDPAPAKSEAPAPVSAPAKEEAAVNKIKGGKYADYTQHDLLVELIKYEKRDAKRTGLVALSMMVIALVFVVSAIFVVPQVLNTLEQIQTTLSEGTSLAGKAEDSLEAMNDMIADVDKVLSDNTDAMEEAITKISDIDVDGLNDSISELREATSALNKVVSGRPF